jgi:mRNA-degrading endonuclease toxin of MazEF toxin-antitoxin module
VNRGDVVWVEFSDEWGRRPALILTRDAGINLLSGITVGPVTTTLRTARSWIRLGLDDGMPEDCCINLDSIHTVRRQAIGDRICRLSRTRMQEVEAAVRFALDLERPPEI